MNKLPLLTAAQLAESWGVPIEMVHKLARKRRIPSVRLGHRTIRFNEDKVRAALEKLELAAVA